MVLGSMTSTPNGVISMASLLERRTMKEEEEDDDIHRIRRMRPRGSCRILSSDALGNMHLQSMTCKSKIQED